MSQRQPLNSLQAMVRACIDEGVGLTEWEQSFVTDIEVQLNKYGRISEKLEEILDRIYSQKTP